ncbi:MAG: hypothetical protein KatS3mg049_2119 [Caldilinea sp.]|nr:MAG: hypothetical protein KatS3mg049_2119 [Caldilinea sp.]
MASRVRLPNKTLWALEDLLALHVDLHKTTGEILQWIECQQAISRSTADRRLAELGELSHLVARLLHTVQEMERITRLARIGEYES